MKELLNEPRVIKPLLNQRLRDLFIDKCSGHILNEDILNAAEVIRSNMNYLFPNSTDLLQPCEYFIIQKMKDAWRLRLEERKLSLITSNAWRKGWKLRKNVMVFFLRLSDGAVAVRKCTT